MEIRVRRQLTGRELRDEFLEKYRDRETMRKLADGGDVRAGDALWNLDRFEEDPRRLDVETTIEHITILDRNDLSVLTETRLRLVQVLREQGEMNLKRLSQAVGRNVKNVSDDLEELESLGLILSHRVGRERRIRAVGEEIVIRV